jgi:hypothetical protein
LVIAAVSCPRFYQKAHRREGIKKKAHRGGAEISRSARRKAFEKKPENDPDQNAMDHFVDFVICF